MVVGIVTPLVWRYISGNGQHECHITAQWIAPIFWELPGSDLIWGVLELIQGSVVNGTSRVMRGVIKAMILGFGVTLGWQFFGTGMLPVRDMTTPLAVSSLPYQRFCPTAFPPYHSYMTWPFVEGVYGISTNILVLIWLNVRIRDWPWPFLSAWVGMMVLTFLSQECSSGDCMLSSCVQNFIAMFVAAHIAMWGEYFSGVPKELSLISTIFAFAPGSHAVLATVAQFRASADPSLMLASGRIGYEVAQLPLRDLIQDGVSYGLALEHCDEVLERRRIFVANKANAQTKDVQQRPRRENHETADESRTWAK
jgi:uncharacterized membrane protein YjjB (DUF3815 family)